MEQKMSFWMACRTIRNTPPSGWLFVRWPKTESSFTIQSPNCLIEVENGVDLYKRSTPEIVSQEMRGRFELRVFLPEGREGPVVTASPEELKDTLNRMTRELYEQYPFRMDLVPKAKYRVIIKRDSPPELKIVKVPHPVGSHVRIVGGPYPKVMRDVVQRVDARRPGEAQVTRWYSRKDRRVAAWVPLEFLVQVNENEIVRDNCLRYAANTSGSAPDMFARGHCKYCSMKWECDWFKRKHAGTNGADREGRDDSKSAKAIDVGQVVVTDRGGGDDAA